MRKRLSVLMLILAVLALSACGRPSVAQSNDTTQGGGAANDCPVATDGTLLLMNEAYGYCLLYPVGYDVYYPSENGVSIVVGSLLNHTEPSASIQVEEAAGRSVAQATEELMVEFNEGVGFDIKRSSATVGGEEAIVLDNMPGQDIHRRVVVIHDGLLYWLHFMPVGADYGEVGTRAEVLYATVVDSLRFLPGSVVVPEGDRPGNSLKDQDLGEDVHSPGVFADGFSARWTRRAYFDGGSYPELLTDEAPGGVVVQVGHPEGSAATHELAANPFHVLLGPIRTADGSSVHPCSGEAPLLCVYQGRTLLGTVELETVPLARDLGFQKVLGDAGIPLGSADYTDLGNVPLVRTALAAHAATHLADLAQDRGVTYADKGYTFTPVAPEEIRIGKLPGVTYGFTGYDGDGRVFERWLTYAAFDNNALYLFTMSYADGVPESFLSDKDLVRFEPYLRQILTHLRLPVGEDWHSPGAELPQGPLLVVQRPDDSIQYVTLDGLSAVLVAEAPSSLLPAGYSGVPFGGTPMGDGPIVYVRQWGGDGFYALDTIMGQLYLLDFVPPHFPVAVRPLTEGLLPEGAPISLAWGEFSAGYTATTRLYLSSPDGSQVVQALEETYDASPWTQFVPWRWREDGQLYYTKQPVEGMGGFPPFVSAANLWLFDPRSGSNVELISNEVTGAKLCLDAMYIDDRRVAHHCDEGGFTILDLETGKTTPVSLPDEVTRDMQLGTARFSPDGSRIAFAATNGGYHGPMEETRGYIAVSDNLSLSGSSHVIVTSQPGEWFTVLGWLSDDRLVLHSYFTGPSGWPAVWTVRADGSGLVKLAEGTFLSGRWHTALF